MNYSTVLFDMFDTLVRFERNRLPLAWIGGREVRSSVVSLYPVAHDAMPGLSLEAFYEALVWSYQEAERRRAADHREVPARDRFRLAYARLGVDPAAVADGVTQELLRRHMGCLAASAEAMPGRAELLDWLRGRYRIGLVSNFDYTPTVERLLDVEGILDRFDTVVVSDAVGWRKPSARIFEAAFMNLGVTPAECVFVGDRPELDVAGAKAVGMDAAWLNPDGADYPADLPEPEYTLRRLDELRPILEEGERLSRR